jgi:hypothetical protein
VIIRCGVDGGQFSDRTLAVHHSGLPAGLGFKVVRAHGLVSGTVDSCKKKAKRKQKESKKKSTTEQKESKKKAKRKQMIVSVLEAGFPWRVRVLQGPAARHGTMCEDCGVRFISRLEYKIQAWRHVYVCIPSRLYHGAECDISNPAGGHTVLPKAANWSKLKKGNDSALLAFV